MVHEDDIFDVVNGAFGADETEEDTDVPAGPTEDDLDEDEDADESLLDDNYDE